MTRPKSNVEGLLIILGFICAAALVFLLLTACPHNPSPTQCNGTRIPTTNDLRTGDYDAGWVEKRASRLGLRTVDYLHQVSSGRRNP